MPLVTHYKNGKIFTMFADGTGQLWYPLKGDFRSLKVYGQVLNN